MPRNGKAFKLSESIICQSLTFSVLLYAQLRMRAMRLNGRRLVAVRRATKSVRLHTDCEMPDYNSISHYRQSSQSDCQRRFSVLSYGTGMLIVTTARKLRQAMQYLPANPRTNNTRP